jgi:hypothetical protein
MSAISSQMASSDFAGFHVAMNPTATPNQALQRTTPGFGVQLPSAAFLRPAHSPAPGPESLSLGSLGGLTARRYETR